MEQQQKPMSVINPQEIPVEPLPAFELIFDDGRRVKLWACGHTEGLDGQVIVINRVAPMLDQLYATARRGVSQLGNAVQAWMGHPADKRHNVRVQGAAQASSRSSPGTKGSAE